MGVLGAAGEDDGRRRGVLVTAAEPRRRDALHGLALPTFRRYADRWDYDLQAVDLPTGPTSGRGTVRLLRRALSEHRLVVWLDPDMLLLRRDEDVAGLLRPRSFQGLVPRGQGCDGYPDAGVWVLRSCPAALAFLQAVEAAVLRPGSDGSVGAAVAACLGGRARASGGTTWLPDRWNRSYDDPDGFRSPWPDDRADTCALRLPRAASGRPVTPADGRQLSGVG
ncbi:MAG TPA: hypothetical protein VFR07_16410 [Mycobacteriales bacterium]|jgi:hypothetical protein|nr:hypothetical protein [Mycobacteriales bacterium]